MTHCLLVKSKRYSPTTTRIPPTVLSRIKRTKSSRATIAVLLNAAEEKYSPWPRHWNAKRRYPYWKMCQFCKTPFVCLTKEQATRRRFCQGCLGPAISKARTGVLRVPRPICRTCKKAFTPKGGIALGKAKTCSYRCRDVMKLKRQSFRRHLKIIACLGRGGWTRISLQSYRAKMTGEKNPAWKGGVTYKRNKGNYIGPKYARCPVALRSMSRTDGYVMEHRLVVALCLNRPLLRQESVHHINHKTRDNRPSNLMLFPSNRDHKLLEHHALPLPMCCPSTPHQSKNPRQSTVQPHALSLESGSQTVRASRFTTSDVVRVEAMPYIGKVWCVSVPTGAFIARRNGKAFITGNSGFPKSLDISKAIDKAAGAEREVIGELTRFDGKPAGKIKPMNGGSFASNAEKEGKRGGISTPSTDAAKQWEGWGTALKPAAEFWILVRKPCSEKTVAENVLRWGTGGINIDQTRIKPANAIPLRKNLSQLILPTFYADMPVSLPGSFSDVCALSLRHVQGFLKRTFSVLDSGSICDTNLWPNVVREFRNLYKLPKVSACDCGPTVSHEVLYAQRLLKAQDSKSYYPILSHFYDALSHGVEGCDEGDFPLLADVRACISDLPNSQENIPLNDSNLHLFCVWAFSWCLYSAIRHDVQSTGRFPSNLLLDESAAEMLDEQSGLAKAKRDRTGGGVSRFFYVAKTSSSERNAGCEDMPDKILATSTGQTRPNKPARLGADPFAVQSPVKNNHPTVRPLKLMRYLCRLITPPGGTVLDPFMGSGSTGIAAVKEGFSFIGIEKEKEYFEIAKKRIGT